MSLDHRLVLLLPYGISESGSTHHDPCGIMIHYDYPYQLVGGYRGQNRQRGLRETWGKHAGLLGECTNT